MKVHVFCPIEIDLILPTCRILGGQLDPSSCLSMSVMSNMYVKPGQPIACDECMSA